MQQQQQHSNSEKARPTTTTATTTLHVDPVSSDIFLSLDFKAFPFSSVYKEKEFAIKSSYISNIILLLYN